MPCHGLFAPTRNCGLDLAEEKRAIPIARLPVQTVINRCFQRYCSPDGGLTSVNLLSTRSGAEKWTVQH